MHEAFNVPYDWSHFLVTTGIRVLCIVLLISITTIQCDTSTDDDRLAALEYAMKQQQAATQAALNLANQTQQEIVNIKHQLTG